MGAAVSLLPEGWSVESEDRSVGVFGDSFFHDACGTYNGSDADHETDSLGHEGEGHERLLVISHVVTCQVCGAHVEWEEREPDPGWSCEACEDHGCPACDDSDRVWTRAR